jgi:opacity protein-like surface antigen
MKYTLARLAATAGFFCLLVSMGARAANPLGLYIGAGGGAAHLRLDEDQYDVTCGPPRSFFATCFDETQFGWTVFAGVQPLPFLGAELQYLDFGHGSQSVEYGETASQHARALAIFGTGTLSLPFVDLYAKAGVGRLQATTSFVNDRSKSDPMGCLDSIYLGYDGCSVVGSHTDSTHARFGGGVGAQFKWSSLALRGEYVRFSVPHADPDLLSLSILWKF